MVMVFFPSLIAEFTGEKYTEVSAKNLDEVLDLLVKKYGEPFKNTIFDKSGKLNRFLNFYLNGERIISPIDLRGPLKDEDRINILFIVSGG